MESGYFGGSAEIPPKPSRWGVPGFLNVRFAMGEASDGALEVRLISQIPQLEAEFEAIMRELDCEQDAVDADIRSLTERQIRVDELNRELSRATRSRNARELAICLPAQGSRTPADSELEGEHHDFIKAQRNAITSLTDAISKAKSETDPLEEEVRHIQLQSAALRCESGGLKKQLQRAFSSHRKASENLQITTEQIRELKLDLTTRRRLLKDAETFRSGLDQRFATASEQRDGKSGIPLSLKNLQAQIYQIETEIVDLDTQIQAAGPARRPETEEQSDGVVHWDVERAHLKTEVTKLNQETGETEGAFRTMSDSVDRLELRYQTIRPLAAKWKPTGNEQTIETDIDDLLRTLAGRGGRTVKTSQKQISERDALAIENGDLQGIVAKRRDEMHQALAKFAIDEAKLREMIRNGRAKSADREQQLVDHIDLLKRKLLGQRLK
jgi:chromosome segregation ATPase